MLRVNATSARCEQPNKNTHTTPSCILQAIEWGFFSGGRNTYSNRNQQRRLAETPSKTLGGVTDSLIGNEDEINNPIALSFRLDLKFLTDECPHGLSIWLSSKTGGRVVMVESGG